MAEFDRTALAAIHGHVEVAREALQEQRTRSVDERLRAINRDFGVEGLFEAARYMARLPLLEMAVTPEATPVHFGFESPELEWSANPVKLQAQRCYLNGLRFTVAVANEDAPTVDALWNLVCSESELSEFLFALLTLSNADWTGTFTSNGEPYGDGP